MMVVTSQEETTYFTVVIEENGHSYDYRKNLTNNSDPWEILIEESWVCTHRKDDLDAILANYLLDNADNFDSILMGHLLNTIKECGIMLIVGSIIIWIIADREDYVDIFTILGCELLMYFCVVVIMRVYNISNPKWA